MTATEKTITLATFFDKDGKSVERLIKASSVNAAKKHVFHICKASADDVARVLGAGGRIEEAAE